MSLQGTMAATTTTTTVNNSSNSMDSTFTTMGPMGSLQEGAVDSLRRLAEEAVVGVVAGVVVVVVPDGVEDGEAVAVMARLRM